MILVASVVLTCLIFQQAVLSFNNFANFFPLRISSVAVHDSHARTAFVTTKRAVRRPSSLALHVTKNRRYPQQTKKHDSRVENALADSKSNIRQVKDDVIEVGYFIGSLHLFHVFHLQVTGTVIEALPNASFRVEIEPHKQIIHSSISGKIRKNIVRVLVGDKVTVELSAYDLTKGRITFRHLPERKHTIPEAGSADVSE